MKKVASAMFIVAITGPLRVIVSSTGHVIEGEGKISKAKYFLETELADLLPADKKIHVSITTDPVEESAAGEQSCGYVMYDRFHILTVNVSESTFAVLLGAGRIRSLELRPATAKKYRDNSRIQLIDWTAWFGEQQGEEP